MRGSLLVIAILACGIFFLRDAILSRMGTFLVVNQPAGRVDVAVTDRIAEKVVQCYRRGDCGKIFVLIEDFHNTWNVMGDIDPVEMVKKEAQEAGIKEGDLVISKPGLANAVEHAHYFKKLFLATNVHSAVFYFPYYKTRSHRFYLDRYLSGDGITMFVQPVEDNYRFERWWENTMLDNLFADEYLEMLYYYFNKLLWSPIV